MKKGSVLITVGLLLTAAALSLSVYNICDSRRAARAAQSILEQLAPKISEPIPMPDLTQTDDLQEIEYPYYVLDPNIEMPVKNIDGYDCIGVLSIPELSLELPVIKEWTYNGLSVSPCRYSGSVYLNDLVIAAHNYEWHFGTIKDLHLGGTVIFTDMDGNEFLYSVTEIETLRPTAVKEMTSGDWDLTLFTCTVGGQSRVTVRCEKLKSPSGA